MGDLELVARVDNRLLLRDAEGTEYRLPICPKLKSVVYAAQATPAYALIGEAVNSVSASATGVLTGAVPAVKASRTATDTPAPKATKLTPLSHDRLAHDLLAHDPLAYDDAELRPRLRPAELQIRLRAGDTPEHLAQFSDLTAAQIAKFAGPIEAERADIIKAMKRVRVAVASASNTVGDLIASRLGARGVTSEHMVWQARRDLGAPWLIELKYQDGFRSHSARWTFDRDRNQLTALDDTARWLSSGENLVPDTVPIALHQSRRAESGRGHHPITGAVRVVDDGPQVSGAPRPLPARSMDDAEAADLVGAGARPNLRPVADEGSVAAVTEPTEPVAGIVPIRHWQAEKLETVALPIARTAATASGATAASATSAKSDGKANPMADALSSPARPKASPSGVLFGAPDSAEPVSEVAAGQPVAQKSVAPQSPNSRPITGSHPAARKNSRTKIPSWDEIVFGAKD